MKIVYFPLRPLFTFFVNKTYLLTISCTLTYWATCSTAALSSKRSCVQIQGILHYKSLFDVFHYAIVSNYANWGSIPCKVRSYFFTFFNCQYTMFILLRVTIYGFFQNMSLVRLPGAILCHPNLKCLSPFKSRNIPNKLSVYVRDIRRKWEGKIFFPAQIRTAHSFGPLADKF